MQSNKSRESRRGNNRRRSKKEEKYAVARMKEPKSDEICPYPANNDDKKTANAEQETRLLETANSDNGVEYNPRTSLMCPSLHRQLQTHKNVLRLLHEYKLASTQINGQRILSIQPVRWSGPTPGIDCEIFVGRIPKMIFEDVLYPLFNTVGEVFQIRLMVDMAELTRGYCFIMYTNPRDAARAINQLDQYEISPGRKIRVLASVNKCKLYIGPLPWHIASEEVIRVIYASAWDIEYVSIYRFLNHDAAYAIVSFKSHRNAALARRKLRPERLFKCNEVHVEWARVDWNPSNVYEDRGMVDDKGEVQITRKYVQSKKVGAVSSSPSSSSSSMQDDLAHSRKQIRPICPPDNINGQVKSATIRGSTRYSTMLKMSAALNNQHSLPDSADASKVVTDINDNYLPSSDGHCRRTGNTNDSEHFRNFDIWNSNLIPPLSPTFDHTSGGGGGSLEDHDRSSNKSLTESPSSNHWGNDTKLNWPSKTSYFGGYPGEFGTPDYHQSRPPLPYCNYLPNRNLDIMDGPNPPIALDAAASDYQALPLSQLDQSAAAAQCYMWLRPATYVCNNVAAGYSQSSLLVSNNHARDDETRRSAELASPCANCDHRWPPRNWPCNGSPVVAADSNGGGTIGKYDDRGGFQYGIVAAKMENSSSNNNSSNNAVLLSTPPNHVPSGYAQNVTLNFTPIYPLNGASRDATSSSSSPPPPPPSRLFAFGNADNEKRLRPILKQANDR